MDYLLKDELEAEQLTEDIDEQSIGKIFLEQANDYLNQKKELHLK